MKLTFWFFFVFLTVALILEILVPIHRYIFMIGLDGLFVGAMLSNRLEIKRRELIIINILFILANNRSELFVDFMGDAIFVILSFLRYRYLSKQDNYIQNT